MIGRLKGIIVLKQPPMLLIDVAGVGYELQASMSTFYKLPEVNQEVTLYTHLVVREDAHELFGFNDLRERTLFRALIKISGIGPRIAMAILSSIDPDAFVLCVESGDTASLTRLPGIGKKTAERLIVEMRDRLSDWHVNGANTLAGKTDVKISSANQIIQDAVSALIALGYRPQEASRAVAKVAEDGLSSEEIIRRALKDIN
jgi:holliday junction DNA helicase RuvA